MMNILLQLVICFTDVGQFVMFLHLLIKDFWYNALIAAGVTAKLLYLERTT